MIICDVSNIIPFIYHPLILLYVEDTQSRYIWVVKHIQCVQEDWFITTYIVTDYELSSPERICILLLCVALIFNVRLYI